MYLPSSLSTGEVKNKVNLKQENKEFNKRLCKTFNYGRKTKIDRPSLSATELLVTYFKDSTCVKFDSVDKYWASSLTYDACISPCSIVFSMLYIDRLRVSNPEYLKTTASQELFIVSMMLASKFIYDEGSSGEVFNEEWARSANLDVKQLNRMEYRFLKAIDWNLFVTVSDFWRSLECIEKRIARKRIRKGSGTYCDLATLSDDLNIYALLVDIFKVTIVATVTYTTMLLVISASIISYNTITKNLQRHLSPVTDVYLPSLHNSTANIYTCERLLSYDDDDDDLQEEVPFSATFEPYTHQESMQAPPTRFWTNTFDPRTSAFNDSLKADDTNPFERSFGGQTIANWPHSLHNNYCSYRLLNA